MEELERVSLRELRSSHLGSSLAESAPGRCKLTLNVSAPSKAVQLMSRGPSIVVADRSNTCTVWRWLIFNPCGLFACDDDPLQSLYETDLIDALRPFLKVRHLRSSLASGIEAKFERR